MLTGKRILLTGPAGNIGFPLARELAKSNELWGASRFGKPEERNRVDELGVITRAVDLGSGEFGDLPKNFDYVLHFGAHIGTDLDYDAAFRVNAEGTALLMQHCRSAKAIIVMSTHGVYRPNPDPWYAYKEEDPLGEGWVPPMPTYATSKLAQEAVARACARQLNIPTIIARMNAAYGPTGRGAIFGYHFDAIRAGKEIVLRSDPLPYCPIHDRDIFAQTEALLDAAAVPCPIVNWSGDEAVSAQEWCRYFGDMLGVTPQLSVRVVPGSHRGLVADTARRRSLTGPCQVSWREGARDVAESHLKRPVEA